LGAGISGGSGFSSGSTGCVVGISGCTTFADKLGDTGLTAGIVRSGTGNGPEGIAVAPDRVVLTWLVVFFGGVVELRSGDF
jgi:hypothetical protein